MPKADRLVNDEKRFDILYDALKDAYKEIIDINLKMATVLIAVIAWFVSHANPLVMLCHSVSLVRLALVFTVVGAGLLLYLFHLLYRRSDQAYQSLLEAGYEEVLFQRFRVARGMFLSGAFGQCTLLIGIFWSIYVRYVSQPGVTCG